MNFYVMTLFPQMISDGLNTSVIGRAVNSKKISINPVNIRDYTQDKHKHVDDYPYGGGAGMVMQAQPVYDCYKAIEKHITETGCTRKSRVLLMTPKGKVFNQDMSRELSREENLILLCGHYEGIDQRVIDEIVTDEVSIGDFVLTGGELPAMVIIDSVSRHIDGVLNNSVSAETESFSDNLLEYPQYTRPEIWNGREVPKVLLSGHHENIEKWRREQSLRITSERRPDLLNKAVLSEKDEKFLLNACNNSNHMV